MIINTIFKTPRPIAPVRCVLVLIILLKLLPRSQIMPPRPINEEIFYPDHIETSSPVISVKLLVPTELEYFH